MNAKLLDRKLSPLLRNGRCHSRFGSSSIFWCVVWFSLPAVGEREQSPSCARKPVDNGPPFLRLYGRVGLGCIRFFDWRAAFDDICFVHVSMSHFYLARLVCGVSLLYHFTTLMRLLDISDLRVVGCLLRSGCRVALEVSQNMDFSMSGICQQGSLLLGLARSCWSLRSCVVSG